MGDDLTTIQERISVIIGRIFIYYPQWITFCVHSVLCMLYHCYLNQIINDHFNEFNHRVPINDHCNSSRDTLSALKLYQKYNVLYTAFIKDHSWFLSLSIKFSLFNYLIQIWI